AMEKYLPIVFPFFFVGMWLFVTTILSVFSGWFALAKAFPDQPEMAILVLKRQSGSMGAGVAMSGLLTVSACPSGLRVGINRLFGPFCRTFFVPWKDIVVSRRCTLWGPRAQLRFVEHARGNLTLSSYVADRLAAAVGTNWPEADRMPDLRPALLAREVIQQWALTTALASGFFIIIPLVDFPPGSPRPPVLVAILFPAIVMGLAALWRYWRMKA